MSTRAEIFFLKSNGTITSQEAGCDGYPAGAGCLLLQHYDSTEKVSALLNLGDYIRCVEPKLGDIKMYGNHKPRSHLSMGVVSGSIEHEFNYLFAEDTSSWYLYGMLDDVWIKLSDVRTFT